jgi:predicted extracellular nuclease
MVIAQENSSIRKYRIVFYNVENLFDVEDDSLTNDDEFTPDGIRHWDNHKFYRKINNIYKVLISVGEWQPPAIVGLCEIENRSVLNKLIYQTPLKKYDYKIIHEDSPDSRGIDVGMIYRSDIFHPIIYSNIEVDFPGTAYRTTRDILYVKGVLNNEDTMHIFVNHWPSRYGGYLVTKPKRARAAEILRSNVDSILAISQNANVLIMGDFNDEPTDESLSVILNAKADTTNFKSSDLLNLMYQLDDNWQLGSHKFREEWTVLDQIIVSRHFFKGGSGLKISDEGAAIFNSSFLLEKDEKYLGEKPFRTFVGMKYNGGFSDHLPVYVDLISEEKTDPLIQKKAN